MLIRLGRMMNVGGQISVPVIDPVITDTLDFLGPSMPSPFQYFRSDTVATYRDSTPKWVKSAAANEPRFDHDASGNPLGLLMEPTRTNKTTQRNFAPTDTTGITIISGTVTASAVDYAPVSAAAIDGVSISGLTNGKAIRLENTGAGSAVIQLSEQAGNTNTHAYRILVAGSAGGGASHGNVALSDGTGITNFTPSAADTFYELTRDNVVVGNSIRYLRWSLPAGRIIYILGTQFEEGEYVTSPIVTDAATATRAHNRILLTTIASLAAWNETEGAIVGEFTPRRDGRDTLTSDQFFLIASNGTGVNDAFGVNMITPRGKGRARVAAAATQFANNDIDGGFVRGKIYPAGISWQNGVTAKAFVGAGVFENYTMSAPATGFTRMYVGGRDTGNSLVGHVRRVKIYNLSRTLAQMLSGWITTNDRAIAFAGQSNSVGYFSQQTNSTNGGERAMQPILDTIWNAGTRNWLINGGTNGTSIAEWTAPSGTAIARWKEIIGAFMEAGGQLKAIVWDQGEANNGDSVSALKSGWLAVFNDMRAFLAAKGGTGNEPVIIIPIGRRTDSDHDYRNLREAQKQLDEENAWIHRAPEKFPRDLADGIHLTDPAYALHGPHVVRKVLKVLGETISGGVDGPRITNAVRSGTTVTVTIAHDGGTDFTPTTGIEGFTVLDGGTPITITGAVRTNATTITLTLASAPSGVAELYYGYRALFGVNPANLVVDNEATYPKPLSYYVQVL
ncbi:MAG: hypothetical protein IPH06_06795 [Alphaproteobacteria bacterium]|nr:hypothetical protein [Alphaproteobacteria bacterium]QQS57723.1 MAG: hypothetical protein IPN28_02560 [Alphaproteobacteria bacterium]